MCVKHCSSPLSIYSKKGSFIGYDGSERPHILPGPAETGTFTNSYNDVISRCNTALTQPTGHGNSSKPRRFNGRSRMSSNLMDFFDLQLSEAEENWKNEKRDSRCENPPASPTPRPGDLLSDTDSRAAAKLIPPGRLIPRRCIENLSQLEQFCTCTLRSASFKSIYGSTRRSGDLNRRENLSSFLTPLMHRVSLIVQEAVCC